MNTVYGMDHHTEEWNEDGKAHQQAASHVTRAHTRSHQFSFTFLHKLQTATE